jgi:hypothetical protein
MANGRYRKKRIFQLEQEEGTIIGEENLRLYISDFYKNLFRAPAKNNFIMREDLVADITRVTPEENIILTAAFTEKEVLDAIMEMEHNKASDQMGPRLNFINAFGRCLKMTLWLCLYNCNTVSCRFTN